ncbi:MAG TPA: alkaline phosphatase family protein [Trebonia sp.]|nr:alkaline phosphatase family protein [Trebonia sp.]
MPDSPLGQLRPAEAGTPPAGAAAVTVAVIAEALAMVSPATASAGTAGGGYARPGANLLLNPGATTGVASARGWDAVTIPGWQVEEGLPTVVDYGTAGFPRAAGAWPSSRGRLFAGGAGGTAELTQDVALRAAPSAGPPRYTLSGWLGGTSTSDAEVTVRFLDTSGQVKGTAVIGPVGRQSHPVLASRTTSGPIPAGTTHAQVTVTLATTLTDDNGPDAPQAGYDYGAAGGLSLSVSQPARQPGPVTPPAAHVPRYQHVFLFYFENEDYSQVIGNLTQAPYLNSLRAQGATLSQFYAEEHPSDANYLAFAGGSSFGIPLDDPEEENPLYTIDAPDIGDLIDRAHESWKAYLQSASGPCDDTVHGYYWNDDQPMMYFKDVRDRPGYCASRVVPLEELTTDLARTSTTPNFAWVSPDDCSDMEGCGIAAGDAFLKAELTAILSSPAWRTQRSLAIITFDEDAQDFQHPAQLVPTIILGSQGVRQGYVSSARYTHYSLLRTTEAALGLGTLTANDRYAPPVNDIFDAERDHPSAPAPDDSPSPGPGSAAPVVTVRPATTDRAAAPGHPVAWVANYGSDTVTPVDLTTRTAGRAIQVGSEPRAVAATPDGSRVYVANSGGDTVTPISASTGQPGTPIVTGRAPWAVAMTPDGRTLLVANSGSGTVTPVSVATGKPGAAIRVGRDPRAITITPDGRTAFVLNWLSGTVTPVDIATMTARPAIRTGAFPVAATLSPAGTTLYVASFGGDTVTPITVATGQAGRPIPAGDAPDALAAAGNRVYVVDGDSDRVTRLGDRTTTPVGYSPDAIAIHGTVAYVVNTIDGTVTPVSTTTGRASRPLSVGQYSYPTAITLAGQTAVVLDCYGGQVSLFSTSTGHVYPAVNVGDFPMAVAVTGA